MKALLASVSLLALAACGVSTITAINSSVSDKLDQLQTDVSQLLVTGQAQITAIDSAALAMTPANNDLHNCAVAGGVVLTASQKLTAATNTANNGPLVAAAVATAYLPGSDQYNWAQSTLVSGCAAEVQKVTGNVVGAGTVLAGIPALLKLAPLAAVAP
jgi:hypothetical protein